MSAVAVEPRTTSNRVPAGFEPRLHAFALDRLLGWGLPLVVGWSLSRAGQGAVPVVSGVLATGLAVLLGTAAAIGTRGTTPGLLATGLRVLGERDARPVGFAAALRRQGILALAGPPTFGLGLATLAWTAASDPGGRRRGWHDQVTGTVVLDVRPIPVAAPAQDRPQPIVNVTALRLAPDEPAVPAVPALPRPRVGPAVPAAVAGPAPAAPAAPAPRAPGRRRAGVPTSRPDAPARPAARAGGWRVRFDTGETLRVEGLVLIGRGPQPRPGESVTHLVPLASSDMSVSKTHAQVQVAADGTLVAMDRGSTNGSVVVRRGVARHLSPGRPMTLLEGDVVRFGDRAMEVVRDG